MKDKYFHIDYRIGDHRRHAHLEAIFLRLKEEKEIFFETGVEPPSEAEYWIEYLDPETQAWFEQNKVELTTDQEETYRKLWELTKPEIRGGHPIFTISNRWELDSIVNAIFSGEYELVKLETVNDTGTLFFNPFAGPFGGTESLVELIEAFGNEVTYDYWHQGPHERVKVGWNFELAKRLVTAGIGAEHLTYSTEKPKTSDRKKNWWEFWK